MRSLPVFLAIALLLAAVPAHGQGGVTITLDVDALGLDHKTCDVVVLAGSDAAAVLDAAVESGCLLSWSGTQYSFGRFVDCIDEVCGNGAAIFAGTYWSLSVNGEEASYGVDGYQAVHGDVIGFDYQTYAFLPL